MGHAWRLSPPPGIPTFLSEDMMDERILTPDTVGDVQDLKPEQSGAVLLTPETKVLCIHRGREPHHDTFDSRHYTIQPGFFTTEYGAAQHFKNRAVVPGSRNPETNFQASFIAIIGIAVPTTDGLKIVKPIDDAVQWEPFTDEECREYGHAVEALDREAMTDPIDEAVEFVPTPGTGGPRQVTSRVKGGDLGRSSRKPEIQGTGKDKLQKRVGEGVAERLNKGDDD